MPAAGLAPLTGILNSLRRPQTAADRTSPLLTNGANLRSGVGDFIVRAARRATVGPGHKPVFLLPVRTDSRFRRESHASVVVELEADGGESPFTAAEIEDGRASFGSYSHLPGESPSAKPHQLTVLVPDGVARVLVDGRGAESGRTFRARVHGNVAIFETEHAIYPPSHMRWYTDNGYRIPIPDPPGTAPLYPTNANGQTYGAEPTGIGESEQPDLIRAIGKALHSNRRVTGYISRSRLDAVGCGDVKTPAQAVRCTQREHPTRIPLYATDGTTIVGSFTTG
jgi:hypothetical protein